MNYTHASGAIRRARSVSVFVFAILTMLTSAGGYVSDAGAATAAESSAAVQAGLAYLHTTQAAPGYWSYGGYEPAATGAAVFAMLSQKGQWEANAAAYQTDVDEGMDYLLSTATATTVSVRNDGVNICPGGTETCLGVFWNAANDEDTYTTGLIAPAIAEYGAGRSDEVATASGALAGLTWSQIAQGITNMFAASQSTSINGNRRGGWRYYLPGNGDSDMSTTQWAIIAFLYDQTLGAVTPPVVKDDLAYWLAVVQAGDGSGCYQPGGGPCDNSNTGGMLLGLNLIGKSSADAAVQNAIGFLNATWTSGPYGDWYGNFGHPYAMWATYKGLETTLGLSDTTHVTNLLPGACGGDIPTSACNWWQDYVEWLVSHQNVDGSWSGYAHWTGVLATSFYLPILPPGARIPTSLDPFQCYRIKDTKGNLCSAAAPSNAGASCESEEDCGGTTDETDFCVPKGFAALDVSLADVFGSTQASLTKPAVLCNPASVEEKPVNDANTHLEGYNAAPAAGAERFTPVAGITVRNALHPEGIVLTAKALKRVLVPSAKGEDAPAPEPGDNDVDHFACYTVKLDKSGGKFPTGLQTSVVDQFAQPFALAIKKPKLLCVPVNKNAEGIKNADNGLLCYNVKAVKGEEKFVRVSQVFVTNQFGREQIDVTKLSDLCIPSTQVLPAP